MKNLIIKGNTKMGQYVDMFNLPPLKTCTPTKWCLGHTNNKPNCYALKGRCTWPNVKKGCANRYESSLQDDFVDRMIHEIQKTKNPYFRFHSSGDFYSEEYVSKVIEIAKACPDKLFRTTTRRRDLADIICELNDLPNFIVRESLDPERPVPVLGLPFAAIASLDIVAETDSYLCKNDCTDCKHYCWEHPTNMHFEQH